MPKIVSAVWVQFNPDFMLSCHVPGQSDRIFLTMYRKSNSGQLTKEFG
jgi:hypothetical protein